MAEAGGPERWLGELTALRREIAEMRTEQEKLARSVLELTQTFRALAMHLGVAAEPYQKGKGQAREREVPGFG
jgi:hypothetical protein